MPEIPEQVEILRTARSKLVPWQTYRTQMPDGSIFEATGAEMIRDADAMVALVDAHKRGDADAMMRGLMRIMDL